MLSVTFALALLQPDASSPGALPMREQVRQYIEAERWPDVFNTVGAWSRLPKAERVKVAELLAPALTNCGRVALKEPADLIIPYRLQTGHLRFQGHGLTVNQDLFTTGGRAAWAIGKLLGDEDLPELNGGLTADEWATRAADIAGRVKDASESQEEKK